ncbi:MAG TPA: hypothetical protein GYA08_06920 [Chloroflexi bacterium]|nr:hypothetical protein [Chloroflexota bacterium]
MTGSESTLLRWLRVALVNAPVCLSSPAAAGQKTRRNRAGHQRTFDANPGGNFQVAAGNALSCLGALFQRTRMTSMRKVTLRVP